MQVGASGRAGGRWGDSVYAENGRSKAGYVPKAHARRLAPLLDAGAELVAVSVRGSGARIDGTTPHVLVCERALYDHLAGL